MSQSDGSGSRKLDEISLVLPGLDGLTSLSGEQQSPSIFGNAPLLGVGPNSIQTKVKALEAFINVAVRNCTFTELLTEILLALMTAVQSEAASILEVDPERKLLFFRCSIGSDSHVLNNEVSFPLNKGFAGQVVESRAPMIIHNVEENKAHLSSIGDALGFQTLNMIVVPLLVRGRVFGVVELINRVGYTGFSADDQEVLSYLSEMAGKIIELRMMIAWKK